MLGRFDLLRHSVEYKFKKYRLTINFWFLILFLLVQTGLNELGYWQLSRAQEKQIRLERLNKNDLPTLTSLDGVNQSFIDDFGYINLEVELAEPVNFLVENRIQNGNLGYHVLNLVREVSSDRYLLINRGWIEGKADRNELPKIELPPNLWKVKSRIYQINQQVLSENAEIENYGKIIRIPVMDAHIKRKLEEAFNLHIEAYLLRLEKDVVGSFNVDWDWVSMSPEKHLGYAFQWFALSLAFLIASLFALIKKVK